MTSRKKQRRTRGSFMLGAFLVLAASPLTAQEPAPTAEFPPFWAGIEVGGGPASAICAPCGENGSALGSSANVFGGVALGRRTRIGVEIAIWTDCGDRFYRA